MLERLADYSKKLRILRQIMSNRARRYSAINMSASLLTVVVSSLLTFMGFSGLQKIQGYVSLIASADPLIELPKIELAFNILVFALFVLLMLHLVFRFGTKQADAERAIVTVTYLINEIDDLFAQSAQGITVTLADVNTIRHRYDMLLQVIPPNSDSEYIKAKKDYADKQLQTATLQLDARDLFDASAQKRVLESLLRDSTPLRQVLEALRNTDEGFYLGGGLIRNAAWDYLHGYRHPTPIDDVDVVYLDRISATKDNDRAIEQRLRTLIPNLKWSVKNQARMHHQNCDTPYSSLEDAVSQWPETATAIAARLTAQGAFEIITPHGLGDLFRLIVSPTPRFRTKLQRYQERINEKDWAALWPRLKFMDLAPHTSTAAGTDRQP